MQYRTLGRTGLSVSEIGLGCEGFAKHPERIGEILTAAEAAGVNIIDLYSSDPDLRSAIGEGLKGRDTRFLIQGHLCTTWTDGQYERTRDIGLIEKSFEDMRARLNREQIDIGMLHYVDNVADWKAIENGPILAYAERLKAEGKIGCIGLSSHNPLSARAAVESGHIDVLMFSVNPCYDLQPPREQCEDLWAEENYQKPLLNMDPDRAALYEACARSGVAVTVMKAFGGGDLLSPYSPAGKALTVPQCLHYALTRPGVVSVLAGAHSLAELNACLAYETASPEERDYAAAFASFPRISWKGHCMYCGHCAPCPVGIDVAAVTKFLNLARAQGAVPETVREHYGLLESPAGACIACGACEGRCPFDVSVIENMKTAAAILGR